MGSITVGYPLEILAIDFTAVEKSQNVLENILVMTDIFTKYSVAIPTRNQKATTVARVLRQYWFNILSLRASTQIKVETSNQK